MTQTETIVWHKYPDEKPPKKEFYLICEPYSKISDVGFNVDVAYWFDKNPVEWGWGDVVAWAELPKGWRDENPK